MTMRLLLSLAASVALSVMISGAAAGAAVGSLTADEVAAQNFRVEFGLRADDAWVRQLSAVVVDPTWGVPLTPSEVADMAQRVVVARAVGALDKYAAEPWYGGVWLEQASGGTVVVNLRGDPIVPLDSITGSLPAGTRFRWVSVSFSLQDLRALDSALGDSLDSAIWTARGVVSHGVDVVANRVRVGVVNPTSELVAEVAQLGAPGMIDVVKDGVALAAAYCGGDTNCGDPMKGGLKISSNSITTVSCTSGFMARPTSGTPTHSYMITSGHCAYDAQYYGATAFSHGAVWTGTVTLVVDYDYAAVDIAILNSVTGSTGTPANQIFTGSTTSFQAITGRLSDAQQPVGTPMCKYGFATDKLCGQVRQGPTTQYVCDPIHCVHIASLQMFSRLSSPGDSGGPLYQSSMAAGNTVAQTSDGNYTYYSRIEDTIYATGYRPCYAATYPC
ncbi:MAG TPA: hypothetical protein VF494_13745 [Candidatus Limnocylindrales bacterium]